MTALLLAFLLPPAAPPAAAPKPVAVTREAEKELLEAHKKAAPRLPMPPADEGPFARVNNGRFRAYYLPKEAGFGGLGGREKDAAETLDPTFKVKLFWVVSRVNNCLYCLGHQEHKLSAAGVTDDGIAALDSDWAALPEKERAAVAFAKKLTFQPHLVAAVDVAALGRHFTPDQCLEIVVAVAGFNSMNRWTDGLNIPADENGDFFKKGDAAVDLSTFRTPTSAKYKSARSVVAPVAADGPATCPPSWPTRPALETRGQVEEQWKLARTRTPVLPVAAQVPSDWNLPAANWLKLLATFPTAGKSRAAGIASAAEIGTLSPRLKALAAWAAAREDRAWYALAIARDRLKALGLTDDQVFALDAPAADRPALEAQVLAFARKLAVAPATVTDADVAALRGPLTDHQVAELVHQMCNAAFLDRVTEAARLPLDN